MAIVLVLVILMMSLKALLEPLMLHCLGICGVLKPYDPDDRSAKKKRAKLGLDQYTKLCAVPYTGKTLGLRVERCWCSGWLL